jgi:hypothetical protein
MSWMLVGSAAVTAVGGYMSARSKASAAAKAAGQQEAAYNRGLDEQNQKLEDIRDLLNPYTELGKKALESQGNLIGLGTPEQQRQAISNIEQGPQFQAMQQQGENSLLQNASATGGLRGGNIEGALAQFRPSLLSSLIQQQFSQLGGLSGQGLQASNALSGFTQNTGNNKSQLFGQIGAAQSGATLAQGAANAAPWQMASDIGSSYLGGAIGSSFKNGGGGVGGTSQPVKYGGGAPNYFSNGSATTGSYQIS